MKLDSDRDGHISSEELYRGLFASKRGRVTREESNAIMLALDTDGNGYLERDEFRRYMTEQIKNDILEAEDTMEDLLTKFRQADIDGNGWLSTAEVQYGFLREMYSELIIKEYPSVKLDELLSLIEECDANKDMKIDIDEFIDYFSQSKIKALSMRKSTAVLNGVMALKVQRRMLPSDFMGLFDRVFQSQLYFSSFLTAQNLRKANLPSEGFIPQLDSTGLGYVDIKTDYSPDMRPTRTLSPIVPVTAGYLALTSATGVPIPLATSFDRKQIVGRAVKLCFFDGGNYLCNTATVEAEWDETAEGKS